MDCFYDSVPYKRKKRIHFHAFMQQVHRQLDALKDQADPMDALAANIARDVRLLCFDEFHVSDIADAMILGRLLKVLFARGVVFVMTSNYPPDRLYPNGLQRDRFLPTIALMQENLDVLEVEAGMSTTACGRWNRSRSTISRPMPTPKPRWPNISRRSMMARLGPAVKLKFSAARYRPCAGATA